MPEEQYQIKFLPKAYDDLVEIYLYIVGQLFSEAAANSLLEKIEKQIKRLSLFPFSGSRFQDEILLNKGYFKLVVDRHLVIYRIDEMAKTVIIVRIIYGPRNYYEFL